LDLGEGGKFGEKDEGQRGVVRWRVGTKQGNEIIKEKGRGTISRKSFSTRGGGRKKKAVKESISWSGNGRRGSRKELKGGGAVWSKLLKRKDMGPEGEKRKKR